MGKPKNTRHTRKYLIIFFDTLTRPEPDPLPGILPNTRPDLILKNPTRWALALCLCELSRAFVTISCSTHLLFISLHPFSFLFFFKRRISSQACRGQQQGNLADYLSRVFVVFVYCFVLGAAYFDSLTLQSKLDEAALLTGAAGAAR